MHKLLLADEIDSVSYEILKTSLCLSLLAGCGVGLADTEPSSDMPSAHEQPSEVVFNGVPNEASAPSQAVEPTHITYEVLYPTAAIDVISDLILPNLAKVELLHIDSEVNSSGQFTATNPNSDTPCTVQFSIFYNELGSESGNIEISPAVWGLTKYMVSVPDYNLDGRSKIDLDGDGIAESGEASRTAHLNPGETVEHSKIFDPKEQTDEMLQFISDEIEWACKGLYRERIGFDI